MTLGKPFPKLGAPILALCAALLFAQMKCAASPAKQQEQQQSPPPSSPPTLPQNSQAASQQIPGVDQAAAKQRKIWTNDDLILLRTPADIYLLEKEAREAAEAEAAAKDAALKAAATPGKEPALDIKLPDTPEETEKMLKNTQDDIQEETVVLDRLRKEFPDTPEEQQPEKRKEIDRLAGNLETLQRDVKPLQEHLQMLREKSPSENPPAPAPPPPN
jgi:hypothetical protein